MRAKSASPRTSESLGSAGGAGSSSNCSSYSTAEPAAPLFPGESPDKKGMSVIASGGRPRGVAPPDDIDRIINQVAREHGDVGGKASTVGSTNGDLTAERTKSDAHGNKNPNSKPITSQTRMSIDECPSLPCEKNNNVHIPDGICTATNGHPGNNTGQESARISANEFDRKSAKATLATRAPSGGFSRTGNAMDESDSGDVAIETPLTSPGAGPASVRLASSTSAFHSLDAGAEVSGGALGVTTQPSAETRGTVNNAVNQVSSDIATAPASAGMKTESQPQSRKLDSEGVSDLAGRMSDSGGAGSIPVRGKKSLVVKPVENGGEETRVSEGVLRSASYDNSRPEPGNPEESTSLTGPGSAYLISRNPRDTAATSPKRRLQQRENGVTSRISSRKDASVSSQEGSLSAMSFNSDRQKRGDKGWEQVDQSPSDLPTLSNVSSSSKRPHDIILKSDPDAEEQALFDQRLCEDEYGVAIRKINQNGKSQLRYVKCISLRPTSPTATDSLSHQDDRSQRSTRSKTKMSRSADGLASPDAGSRGGRSVSNLMGRIGRARSHSVDRLSGRNRPDHLHIRTPSDNIKVGTVAVGNTLVDDAPTDSSSVNLLSSTLAKRSRALAWGNKKKVKLPLERFVCVRKGKTTERTKRNPCPASRLLSLVTDDPENPSLDIEAPTKLDRDKFAKAFARFLSIPLESDYAGSTSAGGVDGAATVDFTTDNTAIESKQRSSTSRSKRERQSAAKSAPDMTPSPMSLRATSPGSLQSNKTASTSSSVLKSTPVTGDLAIGLLPAISPSPTGTSDDVKFGFEPSTEAAKENDPIAKGIAAAAVAKSDRRNGSGIKKKTIASRSAASSSAAPSNGGLVLPSLSLQSQDSALIGMSSNAPSGPSDVAKKHAKKEKKPFVLDGHNDAKGSSKDPATASRATSHRTGRRKGIINVEEGIDDGDAGTDVSSLTAGFDQEIVEELHQALNELRSELEASRAEAARAVKVAEQAIQSAESCSSNDWNSTVTHKAAEAAAQAQKRSAEAMARQRVAEEKLAAERKSSSFWRRQAEAAQEEAGALQTRAAAAEVQRASMANELESERRRTAMYISSLKQDFRMSETIQRESLASVAQQNRLLEIELDGTRRDLVTKSDEAKSLHDTLSEIKTNANDENLYSGSVRKRFTRMGRKKKDTRGPSLLSSSPSNSSLQLKTEVPGNPVDVVTTENLLRLHNEAANLRMQFELLRRSAADELRSLPVAAHEWVNEAAKALNASQSEILLLRERLAMENATRRKLLHEVQDLRGTVRVYCRPRPVAEAEEEKTAGIISVPSQEILLVHRERVVSQDSVSNSSVTPMSFEFDRVFGSESTQKEVYTEMEELILSTLDGFNVCLIAYGQTGSGKTHSMIGDYSMYVSEDEGRSTKISLESYGVHLLAFEQLFTIAQHRNERYQDSFTMTIVEVHNERLLDLVAGTPIAEESGNVAGRDANSQSGRPRQTRGNRGRTLSGDDVNSSVHGTGTSTCGSKGSKRTKLEIRTNYDGDTVVQGLVSVQVRTFEDVCRLWTESLSQRASRLEELGIDIAAYEAEAHVIVSVNVVSTNIATGVGTVGKVQFVDLAGSDLVQRSSTSTKKSSSKSTGSDGMLSGVGNSNEWRFANKSLATLSEVVSARVQFERSVPYRNSTLTHLLRDSLEADTKLLLLVCVSSDKEDLQETASALRFASNIRRVTVGKATKHTVSLA